MLLVCECVEVWTISRSVPLVCGVFLLLFVSVGLATAEVQVRCGRTQLPGKE